MRQQNDSQTTIHYCYDGDQVIAEYEDGVLVRKFIYGLDIDEPICMVDVSDSNKKYYYHFDGLGSVVALSDSSANIIERYSYDVFGEPNRTSSVDNPYYFTGRRLDTETHLYYYRARYYAYNIGRFLQTDPIGYSDGMNLYTYCGNNSVNWADPYGLCKGNSLWERWSDYVRSSDPLTSLGGFGIGILEGIYDIEVGMYHTVRHPVRTIKGIPQVVRSIPASAKQFYRDITSPDPYTFGNTLGRLTAQVEVSLATAKMSSKIIKKISTKKFIKTRTTLGTDGGKSQIIKTKSRITGRTLKVEHKVTLNGKIIHYHQKYP